jgi:hypothetical protein
VTGRDPAAHGFGARGMGELWVPPQITLFSCGFSAGNLNVNSTT